MMVEFKRRFRGGTPRAVTGWAWRAIACVVVFLVLLRPGRAATLTHHRSVSINDLHTVIDEPSPGLVRVSVVLGVLSTIHGIRQRGRLERVPIDAAA